MTVHNLDIHSKNSDEIRSRFNSHATLIQVLGIDWINQELEKSPKQWSSVTGWLNWYGKCPLNESSGQDCLYGLENALNILSQLPAKEREIVYRKIRAHCPRAESTSVLAEISLYGSLVQAGCALKLGQKLIQGSDLDVDATAQLHTGERFHVEIYQIHSPDLYERQAYIGAKYGIRISRIDFETDFNRIREKIEKKTKKLPSDQPSLVAIETSLFSEASVFGWIDEVIIGSDITIGLWAEPKMRSTLNGFITYCRDVKTGLAKDVSIRILPEPDTIVLNIENFLRSWGDKLEIIHPNSIGTS